MRNWLAIVAFGVCVIATHSNAHAQFMIDHAKSNTRLRSLHDQRAPQIGRSFESDQEATKVFKDILKCTGVPGMIERVAIRATPDTPNAAANIDKDNKRYIFYNATFMQQLRTNSGTYWSMIYVVAHEMGHHIAGHLDFTGQNHQVELEADRFAGFILRCMGATHDESIAGINFVASPQATESHPAVAHRVQAISLGWRDGHGPNPMTGDASRPPTTSKTVALQPTAPLPSPSNAAQPPPVDAPPTRDLIKRIQTELARIGCYPDNDNADGLWGQKSLDALAAYKANSGSILATPTPNATLLSDLQKHATNTCGVPCNDGTRDVAAKCIARQDIVDYKAGKKTQQPPDTPAQTPTRRTVAVAPPPPREPNASGSDNLPICGTYLVSVKVGGACRSKGGKLCEIYSFVGGKYNWRCDRQ
jgi:hypothetical protein